MTRRSLALAGRGSPRPTATRRGVEIRAAILEAARTLYASGGYAAVTMRAIADQLGLKASSLYHHFVNKEQIFLALQERAMQMIEAAENHPPLPDPVDDLRLFFWRYYEFSQSQSDYFALLYVDRSAPRFNIGPDTDSPSLRTLIAQVQRKIRRCIETGAFPARTPVNDVMNILWSTIHGPAVIQRLESRGLPDFDLTAAAALELALGGIREGLLPGVKKRAKKLGRGKGERD